MHYYAHHIGDFLTDAGSLPNESLGAYMRMLWRYYADESPLTGEVEDIAFDAGTTPDIARQLLRRFFVREGEAWRNTRCDKEIAKYHGKAEKAKKSANARWSDANPVRTQCERNANAMISDANQQPITNNQEELDQKTLPASPAVIVIESRFDEFWREYPRDEGKKKAREAWARKTLEPLADKIIADVKNRKLRHGQWLDGIIPHATTYINGERWNDAIDTARKPTYGNRNHEKPGALSAVLDNIRRTHGDGPVDLSGFSDDDPCPQALPG